MTTTCSGTYGQCTAKPVVQGVSEMSHHSSLLKLISLPEGTVSQADLNAVPSSYALTQFMCLVIEGRRCLRWTKGTHTK
jgi:hypothetical protein